MDWLTVHAREVTIGAAVAFLAAGAFCCRNGKRPQHAGNEIIFGIPLGIALITSGSLALLFWLLQAAVEDTANAEQEAARAEQEEARAAQAISLTSSISGFNPKDLPPGVELREINFNGKTLHAAQLQGAILPGKDFQDAILTRANLKGADLSHANLLGADLTDSELPGANLERADLRSARFEHAFIETADSLKLAKVNALTCWPQAFLKTNPLAIGLIAADGTVSTAQPADPGEFGHTCNEEPTTIIRCPVPRDADGSFVAVPPAAGARVKDIEWLPSAGGPNANVTWIIEPPSDRPKTYDC
jgi:Pentapeptide repeats (8 copies)